MVVRIAIANLQVVERGLRLTQRTPWSSVAFVAGLRTLLFHLREELAVMVMLEVGVGVEVVAAPVWLLRFCGRLQPPLKMILVSREGSVCVCVWFGWKKTEELQKDEDRERN